MYDKNLVDKVVMKSSKKKKSIKYKDNVDVLKKVSKKAMG